VEGKRKGGSKARLFYDISVPELLKYDQAGSYNQCEEEYSIYNHAAQQQPEFAIYLYYIGEFRSFFHFALSCLFCPVDNLIMLHDRTNGNSNKYGIALQDGMI
jgi:hypothetical protein